jgi:membrane-associated protease RseP (regulator of RpoE activity)
VRLGNREFDIMVDSGSDETFTLNPAGLSPKFAYPPTEGPTVVTLTSDRPEQIGRLADTIYIADYAVPRPVVEMSNELSAMGGGVLKYFTVTFDPENDQVTFYREGTDPIAIPGRRSTGLSFGKTPAYWRVVGVVPGSPAAIAKVEAGSLVTRINGEPVAKWDVRRYEQLLANAEAIAFTFLNGTRETEIKLKVIDLVP